MSESIVITVLVENSVQGRGLMAEHGLAFHVQTGPNSLLFDTGQSGLVAQNARRLGVDLACLRAVALSHGHYDHTGGLKAVWELAPGAPLYAHPAVLDPHFARNADGSLRDIGISQDNLTAIHTHAAQMQRTAAPTEVFDGFCVTGEIPRARGFEDAGGPLAPAQGGAQPEAIEDDQALYFDTRDGLVVLLGCAHAGVVNTLRHIRRLTHGRPIQAVFGGMHLLAASPERIAGTVEALRALGIQRLGPAHCTGAAATLRLWQEFPQACTACCVGSRFVFER